jgi:ribosomal protein L32
MIDHSLDADSDAKRRRRRNEEQINTIKLFCLLLLMNYLSAFNLGGKKVRDGALTPICVKYRNKNVLEISLDTKQVTLRHIFER